MRRRPPAGPLPRQICSCNLRCKDVFCGRGNNSRISMNQGIHASRRLKPAKSAIFAGHTNVGEEDPPPVLGQIRSCNLNLNEVVRGHGSNARIFHETNERMVFGRSKQPSQPLQQATQTLEKRTGRCETGEIIHVSEEDRPLLSPTFLCNLSTCQGALFCATEATPEHTRKCCFLNPLRRPQCVHSPSSPIPLPTVHNHPHTPHMPSHSVLAPALASTDRPYLVPPPHPPSAPVHRPSPNRCDAELFATRQRPSTKSSLPTPFQKQNENPAPDGFLGRILQPRHVGAEGFLKSPSVPACRPEGFKKVLQHQPEGFQRILQAPHVGPEGSNIPIRIVLARPLCRPQTSSPRLPTDPNLSSSPPTDRPR